MGAAPHVSPACRSTVRQQGSLDQDEAPASPPPWTEFADHHYRRSACVLVTRSKPGRLRRLIVLCRAERDRGLLAIAQKVEDSGGRGGV
jgi:hypothetical protein